MTFDTVELDRDLRGHGEKQSFNWLKWFTLAVLLAFSLYIFLWEFANQTSDLYKHAVIAGEFNFADLHSITSRLAYPLWHLFVAALFQVGLPLSWAAAVMCVICKGLGYLLVHRYLTLTTRGNASRTVVTLATLMLMLVTPIYIYDINAFVYRHVGSPTVWHNPTQLAVLVTALLCVPYAMHCWYAFERKLPETGDRTVLPWRKVFILAVLLVLSLSCKPTFMQAMIPAAAVFFLAQWIRHPKNSRYFFQIILAFLPAVAYFLLQYLYYTGVVVPYTSGVAFGLSPEGMWEAIRNMLMMAAFPLFALVCCYRPGFFRDKTVTFCLLMALFSVLEAMFFRETGVRENHGNFNWASMSSAFMLWVVMVPKFMISIGEYRGEQSRLQISLTEGAFTAETLQKAKNSLRLRSLSYLVSFVLLVWHVYSSFYYLYYLFVSGNTF